MPPETTSSQGSKADLETVPSLINGKSHYSAKTFPVISPLSSTTIHNVSACTPDDALLAVNSAAAAFPSWSSTKPTFRRDILLKTADILERDLVKNAEIMQKEMGADVGSSQHFIVPLSIRLLRDIAGRITGVCGSVPIVEEEGKSAMIWKEAMGVILGIVPWNAPFVFGIRSAACALATGNTTIIKSSELSPKCYHALGLAFQEAGLPPGCLNVISCPPSDAAEVVRVMIEHPAVRKVNFTGSTATGRKIAKVCGENLKPCLMELGGKNSAIVCEDADLEGAVKEIIAGAFLGSGQICMSTDRIILHTSIASAFLSNLKETLAKSSSLPNQQLPNLVSAASKQRVENLISSTTSSGAHVLHGAIPPSSSAATEEGKAITTHPTIITDVQETMPIWNEEAFAPLAACMVVNSDEEAIALANRGGYGLSASVFTEDLRRGFRIARKLESGAVHINSMTVHDEPVLPHGGLKNSGWGRFNAEEGLNEFLVTKSVTWKD